MSRMWLSGPVLIEEGEELRVEPGVERLGVTRGAASRNKSVELDFGGEDTQGEHLLPGGQGQRP